MSLFGSKQPKELLPSSTVNSEFETFLNVSTITDLVPGCSAPTDIISSSHIDLVANTHTQVSRMSSITHVSPNSSCSVHTETDVVIKQEFDNIDVNTTDKSELLSSSTVNSKSSYIDLVANPERCESARAPVRVLYPVSDIWQPHLDTAVYNFQFPKGLRCIKITCAVDIRVSTWIPVQRQSVHIFTSTGA